MLPFFIVAMLGLIVYFITMDERIARPFDIILLEIADLCEIEIER